MLSNSLVRNTRSPQNSISPTMAVLMYFIVFFGVFCLLWVVMMLFGYPHLSKPGEWIALRIQNLTIPFFLYIIYAQLRLGSFKRFSGLSLPIIVLLIMIFCRSVVDILHFGQYSGLSFIHPIYCMITIVVFSVPINRDTINKAFYAVYIPLFIMGLICVISWYDWILGGQSFRGVEVQTKEIQILQSLWLPTKISGSSIGVIGTIGASLSLLSFLRCHFFKFHLPIFILSYLIGVILLYFASVKSMCIGYACAWIIIALMNRFWKSWKKTGIIIILIIINIVLFFLVGCNDTNGVSARFYKYLSKELKNDVQTINIVNTSSPSVTTVATAPEVKKEEIPCTSILVHNPYSIETSKIERTNQTAGYKITQKVSPNNSSRIGIYRLSIKAILQNPIFGYGSNLVVYDNKNYYLLTSHNFILRIGMATGVIGLLVFFMILFQGFYDYFIVCCQFPEFGWLGTLFIFSFVTYLFSSTSLYDPYFWLPLVVLRACVKTQTDKKTIFKEEVSSQ